ncbi:potassium transporter Kup [Cypionkella sp.]|uniref:potassium transporter Kup n=1 Tax=Cypionkella sp. TaxID=2811411 RepID=UPI00271AA56A|nr:potassium transporter Kup [Cypionkella sp.]MDO8986229.1 potassium transporter Kup [Cypionkella sp.]MDP2051107.1 potassium transporter Kup [Cypionkella sp.]
MTTTDLSRPIRKHPGVLALSLGSIGVVYGDIGTSPLYAFREAVRAAGDAVGDTGRESVLGVLSLILWALFVVVTLKYVVILLRADNQGEGGTLSLLALAQRAMGRQTTLVLMAGLVGAALFYGDAAITPAISVLSAVEGLSLVTSQLDAYVLPITLVIIVALFAVQSRGTAAVASLFGPITLVWFGVLAWGGLAQIVTDPAILNALNPIHAARFLVKHGSVGLIVLGAVFLAVTGAEALYADLGHFGRRPITLAWVAVALPALVLNYLGQGVLVLQHPEALANPFYLMYPDWALLPVVLLATMATIIASQAVITGAFSLTRQAIQLRLLPRLKIRHTSETQEGQIYLPSVNALLLVAVLALVVGFGNSAALAHAYGISVTGTMVVTALLALIVVNKHWGWPLWAATLLMAPFLLIDLIFLGANLLKVFDGGYVPLALAALVICVMLTWRQGTAVLVRKEHEAEVALTTILRQIETKPIPVIPGTAIYLTSSPDTAPVALMHSLKHFKSLHAQNVILTIVTATIPRVAIEDRVQMEEINPRFRRITLTYGYMEDPNVPEGLILCRKLGWKFDIMSTSFLLSRRSLKLSSKSTLPGWQRRVFIFMARNAAGASDYFHIPAGRVVEIGTQVNL